MNVDPSFALPGTVRQPSPSDDLRPESPTPCEIDGINLARLKQIPLDPPAWIALFYYLVWVFLPNRFRGQLNHPECEDIAGETVKICITTIHRAKGQGYVKTIARNEALHFLRHRKRFVPLSHTDDPDNGYSEGQHKMDVLSQEKYDSKSARRGMVDLMKDGLATLTEEDREFIVAYAEFKEANPESKHLSQDFGAIHKLTAVNVRRKLGIIRAKLRGYLQKQQADGP